MEKPCCDSAAARMIKKLTLRDGFQVGLLNLESILKEVADLKLVDIEAVKKELLDRVKSHNYLVPGADDDYSEALLKEYKQRYGETRIE